MPCGMSPVMQRGLGTKPFNAGSVRRTATREAYFGEAVAILDSEGFDALCVRSIVERLGVTKGSFYHHFKNWDDFVLGFLDAWEDDQTDRIISLAEQTGTPAERTESFRRLAARIPHATEAALRAWSQKNTFVNTALRRVDRRRHSFCARMFTQLVGDETQGELFAWSAMAIMVGAQQMLENPTEDKVYEMFGVVQTAMTVARREEKQRG